MEIAIDLKVEFNITNVKKTMGISIWLPFNILYGCNRNAKTRVFAKTCENLAKTYENLPKPLADKNKHEKV